MKDPKQTISIIIPAYNEEKRIALTLEKYADFFKEKMKSKSIGKFEILVVINNTQDKTEEIVKSFCKKYKEIKYLNFVQGGKGFAIIEGFKYYINPNSKTKQKNIFNLIGFVDADMSTSPEAFFDLIEKIKPPYEGVIASRYLNGSMVNPKQSFRRIFVSRIFNFLIRVLFLMPYKDTQCGAKIFTRNSLNSIINNLNLTQWAFDVDLLYQFKKKNIKILESPTIWSDKEYSKINFIKAGPRMALAIIRLRVIDSKFSFLIRAYDKLPEWIKIHH